MWKPYKGASLPNYIVSNDLGWTTEVWNGDDKPYEQIRKDIDLTVAKGQNLDTMLTAYKILARQHPLNPQAQFRWGYFALQLINVPNYDYSRDGGVLTGTWAAVIRTPFPRTYNYARLRFLLGSQWSTKLTGLGERLLRLNSSDDSVKYHLASMLQYSDSFVDRHRALLYAQQLFNKDNSPSLKARNCSLLAALAYQSWIRSKQRADADKAVAAYQYYLQIAPVNDPFNKSVPSIIQFIRQKQDMFDKGL